MTSAGWAREAILCMLAEERAVAAEARCAALEEALLDMVYQHCSCGSDDPKLDSMALSANADAMRLLAEYGKLTITTEVGRRILALAAAPPPAPEVTP